jgi:tRNA dimethylallyltransferase
VLPKLLAIVGPTASGKTALGIRLAKKFYGEVISVDSRQVYRGMDVGTGKMKEQEGVPHWGLDLISPSAQDYSVAEFKKYAEEKIQEILGRGNLPILVGGTGLWMRAVTENLLLPDVPSDKKVREELSKKNLDALLSAYAVLDPVGSKTIQTSNKRRLIRAIEVCRATGRPFSEFLKRGDQKFQTLKLGLEVPKEELFQKIAARVDQMIQEGLVDEVQSLMDRFGCDTPAMSGIGYRQICRHLQGEMTLVEAIADIKKSTRAFAKRQITWFKKEKGMVWIKTAEEAFQLVQRWMMG